MKRRKTRAQKIIADLRRQVKSSDALHSSAKPPVVSETVTLPTIPMQQPSAMVIEKNLYLKQDIAKTAIVTGLVIVSQFFLFFLLTHHVMKVPGLTY